MKDLIVKDELQSQEELENKEKEKVLIKNECFLTRYVYEGISNAQGDSLIIVDDRHGNQRRRYYNSRKGV